ncbi:hypothetical protein AB205_0174160, partial [Aquarana catesbeiana]
MLLLGEQPKQEWTAELSRLIRAEMRLDESYRALRWYVAQDCPGSADDSPTEGFDYDGLGLLYWRLSRDPDFGSDMEWRLEEIMEHRERRMNVSEGHWAQEDLEFLAVQEWELEIAYRQLLDSAQQQGGAPLAWDYQEIPVDNSKILAEESAVENLEIAMPKAEVLTTGQSSSNLCPALEEQTDEPPAEELVSGPNFSVLCPAPTAVSVELQGTSPAEALVTGQRVQDLCPTPVAVPEAHGEKVANTSQWISEMQGGEAAIFPPQQGFVHLGDNASEREFQQQTAPQNDDTNPAEALATKQSATNLCPAPATTTEFQGAVAVGLPHQQLAGEDGVGFPAEGLATGKSAAGLCPQLIS